ncbi:MAG: MarR family winged helix-turn-helix transcriptional regulator [Longimicrobiales bacterium]
MNQIRRDAAALTNLLLGAAHALQAELEDAFAAEGLSSARYGVLEQLARAPDALPLSELAARQSCVRSNMTQLIDRLEADGLVRRVADPEDRRSVRAELTSAGRERQAAGAKQLRRVQEEFAAAIPAADRAPLERALAVIGRGFVA